MSRTIKPLLSAEDEFELMMSLAKWAKKHHLSGADLHYIEGCLTFKHGLSMRSPASESSYLRVRAREEAEE